MSYELCNSITLDKKRNVIKLRIASNNWRPLDYHTCELCNSEKEEFKDYTFKDKMACLLDDLISGYVVISSVNKSTIDVLYAYTKLSEEMELPQKYDCHLNKRPEYKQELAVATDRFMELLKAIDGTYILTDDCSYIHKIGRYNADYNGFRNNIGTYYEEHAQKLDYKTAYMVVKSLRRGFEVREVKA